MIQECIDIRQEYTAFSLSVECAGHDERLEGFLVEILVRNTRDKIRNVGKRLRAHDRIRDAAAEVFYAVESESNRRVVHNREIALSFVYTRRHKCHFHLF